MDSGLFIINKGWHLDLKEGAHDVPVIIIGNGQNNPSYNLDEAVCISLTAYISMKSMHSTILPPTITVYTLTNFLFLSIFLDSLVFYVGTSLGGLWFILISLTTCVFINGLKNFVWFLMSLLPQFPCQRHSLRNSHFRHLFITAHWTALINTT